MSNTNQHGVQVNTVPNNTHVGSFSSAGESTYSVSYSLPWCTVLYALMGEEGCYGPSLPTNTSNLTMWPHPQ